MLVSIHVTDLTCLKVDFKILTGRFGLKPVDFFHVKRCFTANTHIDQMELVFVFVNTQCANREYSAVSVCLCCAV